MMISSFSISVNGYSNEGTISIPIDGKVISFQYDPFQNVVYVLVTHQENYTGLNTKSLKWFRINTLYPYNIFINSNLSSNLYHWSDVKFGINCHHQTGVSSIENFMVLYQVEMSLEEIRDNKLNYLLDT